MEVQDKPTGGMSKAALYNSAKYHAPRAIEVLAEAMERGESYAVKVGAAKVLLAKCIPDLKATELTGKDGESLSQLWVRFINDNNGHTS